MKRYLVTILSVCLFYGCSERTQHVDNQLSDYLETVHSKEINDALYIVVPVNSCNGCRQIVYRNLLSTSHKKEIKIVFSGKVKEALTTHYLGRLDLMGVELLTDLDEKAKDYGLIQEEYPMEMISFLDVIDGEVVTHEILKPDMINGEIDIRKDIFKNYIN